jgi:signal transduction histidine kinase
MIKLKNYIALIYALFICITVLILGLVVNLFAERLFSGFIKDNIRAQNEEIVRSFAEQYNPGGFDLMSINAIGMHFLHQGYLVSLKDSKGAVLWNAREMDMQQCTMVINEIAERMENQYQVNGDFQISQYDLKQSGIYIGQVNVESYGPFFYSENEAGFLNALNKFLVFTGIIFIVLSVVISIYIAAVIAKPVLQSTRAAHRISGGDFSTRITGKFAVRELHDLSRSVNDLAAALENGEEWQKRLTSDIAHELRTPLTSLQGNIEALIDGIWQPTKEHLESCHEEIVRLHKLVEDLNLLSILERNTLLLHKTNFDLADLLNAVTQQYLPQAHEKGIDLITDLGESPVYADYDRLMQVFVNLMSNAVKYTDQGNITVTVKPAADPEKNTDAAGDTHYEISITDTGIGIPEDALPHIFERFYRSDKSRNRKTGGAGIGLTIAAAIVEAHHGVISAENKLHGVGTVFRVVL